jgi:hypothetical protein
VSWSVYDGPLEFRAGPSRGLAAWLVLGHLLAAGAALAAGLPVSIASTALAWLPFSLRRALRPLGPDAIAIGWSAAGGWQRIGLENHRQPMELHPGSVVTNGAMFLHWTVCGSSWRIVLPHDAMRPDDWRRMKVIFDLHDGQDRMKEAACIATRTGRTSTTAPGLQEWRMDSPGFRGACPNGHKKQRPVAGRKGPAR